MRSIVNCTILGVVIACVFCAPVIESVEASAQGQIRHKVNSESYLPRIKPVALKVPTLWEYSSPLISPEKRDSNPSRAQKDPTVVFHDGKWHVFMTVKLPGRSAIEYCSFEKWEEADA